MGRSCSADSLRDAGSALLRFSHTRGPFRAFQIHPVTYCCFDFEGRESNLRRLGEALGAGAGKGFRAGAGVFLLSVLFVC